MCWSGSYECVRGLNSETACVCVEVDLRSWRMAAREWMRMLGMHEPRGPSLGALRGEWRHLVTDVRNPWWRVGGAVYVGRTPRFGPTTYGNRAYMIPRSAGMSRTRLRNEHERAVRTYAVWLGQPECAACLPRSHTQPPEGEAAGVPLQRGRVVVPRRDHSGGRECVAARVCPSVCGVCMTLATWPSGVTRWECGAGPEVGGLRSPYAPTIIIASVSPAVSV